MEIYHELLRDIYFTGTDKPPARIGMPGTRSIFGHQIRHDLSQGFPLLTTKPMYWKGIVHELLWFLRGDTNIKYLIDNGVHIWDEDSYNYYVKKCKQYNLYEAGFETFIKMIRDKKTPESLETFHNGIIPGYRFGDCGYQYGKVWRVWKKGDMVIEMNGKTHDVFVDQIRNLIHSLRKNPESRRHILTAIDPAHDQDLALYWCHCLVQFNCRPLTEEERSMWVIKNVKGSRPATEKEKKDNKHVTKLQALDKIGAPKYYLDCSYYQRSADVMLGVPFNFASYALLTHILSKMCNMIPGEIINTFGDVHIYENHMEASKEQQQRSAKPLPELPLDEDISWNGSIDEVLEEITYAGWERVFHLVGYDPHPKLKNPTELSTGLKK